MQLSEMTDQVLAARSGALHRIQMRVGFTPERQKRIDAVYMERCRRVGRPQHGCYCRECCSWTLPSPKAPRRRKAKVTA